MRRIVGLTILIVFFEIPVAYGAANVWDFAGPFEATGVERLPDGPDRLEIWDFWKPGGSVNGGGGTGSLPLPSGRTESTGDSRSRGISDPPDTLEIWDFWRPGGNLEVWDFVGLEME